MSEPSLAEAERIGCMFGLTYLSATGYAKLADVISYVRNKQAHP